MGKKNKKVKYRISDNGNPKITKQLIDPGCYDALNPSWRFSKLAPLESKWAIRSGDETIKKDILSKLIHFETMTWMDIKSSQTHKSHNVNIDKIITPAQKELVALNIYEDQIFSLRLAGKERIWGILSRGVLEIIWYDPKHEICPSTKK